MLGAADISVDEIWHSQIFWRLRLPRVLMSVLVGAVLSVCGAAYQSIFRNPLTDPYVLGVSSGASLGAAVAILLGLEAWLWGVGGMALAAALATVWLIYRIASIGNRMHTTTLLLTGVCLTLLISALISFLMVLNQEKMDNIHYLIPGQIIYLKIFGHLVDGVFFLFLQDLLLKGDELLVRKRVAFLVHSGHIHHLCIGKRIVSRSGSGVLDCLQLIVRYRRRLRPEPVLVDPADRSCGRRQDLSAAIYLKELA